MRTPQILLSVLLGLFLAMVPTGESEPQTAPESFWHRVGPEGDVQVKLHFFWSLTCPHCARAHAFLEPFAEARPWLLIQSHEVSGSAANRELFALLAASMEEEIRGVPAFFLCSQMVVGYDSPEGMGAYLGSLVEACRDQLQGSLSADAAVERPAPQNVAMPVFGQLDAGQLYLPVLTLILAGVDAFNPCAFFVLLFLLSLLVHARSRARMLLVGGIFVLFSGLLYFVFMAAWLNLFLVLEGVRAVTFVAGLVAVALALVNLKDFFLFRHGPSLSIPERAKPGLFARMWGLLSADNLPALLTGTVALAIAANTYELLCTSGFPLVYTRALTLNDLSTAAYYLYLGAYNAIYVLPLLIIVLTFTLTLGGRKLTETQGRVLKLLSGTMMLGLGLVLLAAPDWLDNWMTAVGLLAASGLVTWIAYLVRKPNAAAAR